MKCKLLKTDICKQFGKYYNKKYYEYGLYTKEEQDKISQAHTAKRREIMQLKESHPEKYANLSYPKMMLPVPTTQDIKECAYQHEKEKVFDVVVKHNQNIQIFVENPKETVEEDSEIVKRGRPKNG